MSRVNRCFEEHFVNIYILCTEWFKAHRHELSPSRAEHLLAFCGFCGFLIAYYWLIPETDSTVIQEATNHPSQSNQIYLCRLNQFWHLNIAFFETRIQILTYQ